MKTYASYWRNHILILMHQLSQDLLKQKRQRSKQSKGDRLYLQFLWLRWPINHVQTWIAIDCIKLLQTSQRHTSPHLFRTKRKKEETLKTILQNDIPHVPGVNVLVESLPHNRQLPCLPRDDVHNRATRRHHVFHHLKTFKLWHSSSQKERQKLHTKQKYFEKIC